MRESQKIDAVPGATDREQEEARERLRADGYALKIVRIDANRSEWECSW